MCLFGIVERPGVSWDVLGCPGVIRLTLKAAIGMTTVQSRESEGLTKRRNQHDFAKSNF